MRSPTTPRHRPSDRPNTLFQDHEPDQGIRETVPEEGNHRGREHARQGAQMSLDVPQLDPVAVQLESLSQVCGLRPRCSEPLTSSVAGC